MIDILSNNTRERDKMRVIGVIGLKNSGKTTLICDILKEIKKNNNINIAIIKHSSHDVKIDKEGTDSYKFKKYANISIISDVNRTIFFYDKMDLNEILSKLDSQLVIIEGFKEQLKKLNIPKIVMIKDGEGSELIDSHTLMVIKDMEYNIGDVVKNVLEKSIVPTYNLNCGHCGYICKEFVEKVVKGNLSWDQCVISEGLEITVNGKTIPLNPFVSNIVKNTIIGLLSSLKGVDNPESLTIKINKML